jgi:hypothetical protein
VKINLAGLYIQIEAKKRRIKIITVEIVPNRADCGATRPGHLSHFCAAITDCHPDRSLAFLQGMLSGVEGPAVLLAPYQP